MSVITSRQIPMGDTFQRVETKETLWRLAAFAFAHPNEEFHKAWVDGSYYEAFNAAWLDVNGRIWPRSQVQDTFSEFEAGYISIFLHNKKGKPVTSLRAGDHEELLKGLSRPVFMLNLTNFYRHFGLKAATEDEGRLDEPDHIATMLEFMAVLCHLEGRALKNDKDASPYRRAQRDFLSRFMRPLFLRMNKLMQKHGSKELDPMLRQLVLDFADWTDLQISELELRTGSYIDPDAPKVERTTNAPIEQTAKQNLWG